MSSQDLDNLRRAYSQMMMIRDNRGYNYQAAIHSIFCQHGQRRIGSSMGLRLFLPWHRAYLYMFEQAAKDIVPDVFIPWWDWRSEASSTEGIPKAFTEQTIGGGTNPLAKARIRIPVTVTDPPIDRETRRFPDDPSELPTSIIVEDALSKTDFGDFSDEMELIHNGVHVWVGGDMATTQFAGWDPIFWSHHSMIDRTWWLWQLRHGINNIPSELLDLELAPFPFTIRRVLSIHKLGYDYAGAVSTVRGNLG